MGGSGGMGGRRILAGSTLPDRVQHALEETRMLMLAGQVVVGFQLRSVFESGFDKLPRSYQQLKLVGMVAMLVTITLLLFPGAYHRIVARGEDSERFHLLIGRATGPALLPFGMALAIDMRVGAGVVWPEWISIAVGALVFAGALLCFYGIEALGRRRHGQGGSHEVRMDEQQEGGRTDVGEKIKHVLTEARVVIPGVQALLGFQFTTVLMEGFAALPSEARHVHVFATLLNAIAVILLVTPAAWHRIVEQGEESERFHRFASRFVVAALPPLGISMCAELYVVLSKVLGRQSVAIGAASAMLVVMFGLWFGFTLAARARLGARVGALVVQRPRAA